MKKILIIKHGSLGDIIFSLPVMHTINQHYKSEQIQILTQKKYFEFFKLSNYFNNLIEDNRSGNILTTIKILFNILKNNYDLIIDLQNSSRTSYYNLFFRVFSSTKICSSRPLSHFRYNIPPQGSETTTQGLFNQIKILKIKECKNIEYSWLNKKLDIKYSKKIILFIPGVSKNGKYKQWDPNKFGELAKYCENKGYRICVIGTDEDRESVKPILNNCKNIINNINNSPPAVIYSIALKSSLIITNDTGPGHIASLSNKNILWLLNDNNITKANINNNKNNYKVMSNSINDLSFDEVKNFIEINKLL